MSMGRAATVTETGGPASRGAGGGFQEAGPEGAERGLQAEGVGSVRAGPELQPGQ